MADFNELYNLIDTYKESYKYDYNDYYIESQYTPNDIKPLLIQIKQINSEYSNARRHKNKSLGNKCISLMSNTINKLDNMVNSMTADDFSGNGSALLTSITTVLGGIGGSIIGNIIGNKKSKEVKESAYDDYWYDYYMEARNMETSKKTNRDTHNKPKKDIEAGRSGFYNSLDERHEKRNTQNMRQRLQRNSLSGEEKQEIEEYSPKSASRHVRMIGDANKKVYQVLRDINALKDQNVSDEDKVMISNRLQKNISSIDKIISWLPSKKVIKSHPGISDSDKKILLNFIDTCDKRFNGFNFNFYKGINDLTAQVKGTIRDGKYITKEENERLNEEAKAKAKAQQAEKGQELEKKLLNSLNPNQDSTNQEPIGNVTNNNEEQNIPSEPRRKYILKRGSGSNKYILKGVVLMTIQK